ncbi:MAG: hypothetical protein HY716_04415 [Planctomycetes bacterium]|nr:hypothetical protein [Planctomycetota bacterium]
MAVEMLSWFRRKKELTLADVKREEIKLGIRENQTIAKLERTEKEREEIFSKGSKIKSPSRRRQLARLYDMKSNGLKLLEHELNILSKELTTISALKLALERRERHKEGIAHILNRVDEARLMVLLEDDKVTQEMYVEKLNEALSIVSEGSRPAFESLGKDGDEILQVWQKMDEGEIDTFEEGLREADQRVRQREKRQAELEGEADM